MDERTDRLPIEILQSDFTANFSLENLQARREWKNIIFKD